MLLKVWISYSQKKEFKLYSAGSSKGGIITYLSSKRAYPFRTLVSSGWSETFKLFEVASVNQFIWEGAKKFYSGFPYNNTKYIFTYGEEENDTYGWEYKTNYTCDLLKRNSVKIECLLHKKGHFVTEESVKKLFEN